MQHKPNAITRHESPKLNTLSIHIFSHSACWVYQRMLVYNAEHILTWKHLTTLKDMEDGRHLSWIQNIYYFIMCPLTTKRGHSAHMFILTVRETKEIKLFHIGLAQGISKMTTLKATCIAPSQGSAWLKLSHFMLSCPQGWRGGEAGASSPSSCTTGLKQMQNNLHVFKISFPCIRALPPQPLGRVRNMQLQLKSKFFSREQTLT